LLPKKILTLALIIFSMLFLSACSSGSQDTGTNTAAKSAQQIAQESFDKWNQLKSYDLDMKINMKAAVDQETVDMSITSKSTVFQNPLKMKTVMETTIPGLIDKMEIEQYMIQQDQKITLYQQVMGQWQKMVFDEPAMADMLSVDPKENLQLFMDNLVKAESLGEEKIGERNTLKIGLVASSKIFEDVFKQTAGSSFSMDNDIFNADLLTKIGDMNYTIWIDKSTLEIVKCQMDLTQNMRNLADALSQEQEGAAEMKEVFKNMEISVEYSVSNQDKAQDFTLPAEALNAQEISLDGMN